MPYIDTKITKKLSEEDKSALSKKLGEAVVSVMNKPEAFLMLGFEDEYELYFGGAPMEIGAFVSVKLFGGKEAAVYDEMTKVLCKIYEETVGVPKDKIYITYQGIADWGWNDKNFGR